MSCPKNFQGYAPARITNPQPSRVGTCICGQHGSDDVTHCGCSSTLACQVFEADEPGVQVNRKSIRFLFPFVLYNQLFVETAFTFQSLPLGFQDSAAVRARKRSKRRKRKNGTKATWAQVTSSSHTRARRSKIPAASRLPMCDLVPRKPTVEARAWCAYRRGSTRSHHR